MVGRVRTRWLVPVALTPALSRGEREQSADLPINASCRQPLKEGTRSAAADEFAAACQSECAAGGRTGGCQRPGAAADESAAERTGASVGPEGRTERYERANRAMTACMSAHTFVRVSTV